jgi:N-acetylneuraminic acid mutarotase
MRSGIRFGICTLLLVAGIPVIGCGGSGKSTPPASTSYTVGGTVTGFTGTGLVLQNNGGSNLTVSANATSFTFATPVASGGVYSVTVLSQPAGESCTVTNGDGTATANVANVSVTCTSLFSIGGTITGLTGPGLVLQDNGGDSLAVSANATSFTFDTPLASGSAYSIAVLTQPVGENCTVANGTGTASANITSASVVCTQLYDIGGTVTGLNGAGLVLQDNGGDNLTVSAGATSFTFATPLTGGSAYSVTVLTQPAGENCTVTDGSGTVVTDVDASVVCVGEWSWMGGSSSVGLNNGQAGVYGTLGNSSPTNIPGGREQSATWKDASGNTWLFGGNGYDSVGTLGQLNDLWKFDPTMGTSGEWTWMSGSNIASLSHVVTLPNGEPGVYGTVGVAAPTNAPGGREQSVTWIDASGNLWIFGGLGIDSVGNPGYLNDLWEFNPNLGANGEWTWMGGSTTAPPADQVVYQLFGQPGVYGTLGTPAPTSIPGGRYGAYAWTDALGNLWLYGGNGFDAAGANGYLNDLWEYTPGANGTPGNWTWMGGNATVPPSPAPWIQSAEPGVYGTLGTPDSANIPGGRSSGVTWADASGNLWLFGGLGADSAGNTGYLNDLWKYTPGRSGSAGEWTWMGGGNTIGVYGGQPGVYGVLGISDSTSIPGARFSGATWVDPSGNLWLFGGQGYDWTGTTAGFLNDLWKYTPDAGSGAGQWTWMGGSNIIPPSPGTNLGVLGGEPGVYGTLGTPASTNTPGARIGAAPWIDASGNLWFFGGLGYDSNGSQGYLNDCWKYQP